MEKERSKSRSIQSELLRMAEDFATDKQSRPAGTSIEWNRKGTGNLIEDWEFTNEAIKSLLSEHYKNKGNPFTQVKIDSRDQLGDYLRKMDYAIIHTSNGHVFRKGLTNHFGDFPDKNRVSIISSKTDRHQIIIKSGVTQHSSAEGVFLGSALFMEEKLIRDFLGIPEGISTVLIPSHRRKFNNIQVEIDSMLIWVIGNHTYIAIIEVKSDSRKTPNWSGGYSYHQVKNTSNTVRARFDQDMDDKTTIIPVYFRSEWNKNSDNWTARLDRFKEIKDSDSIPQIESSLDILHLPR